VGVYLFRADNPIYFGSFSRAFVAMFLIIGPPRFDAHRQPHTALRQSATCVRAHSERTDRASSIRAVAVQPDRISPGPDRSPIAARLTSRGLAVFFPCRPRSRGADGVGAALPGRRVYLSGQRKQSSDDARASPASDHRAPHCTPAILGRKAPTWRSAGCI
jgi:hypothetical protein